jgi:tRNA A-37 threonylcarbamoyl transferase component Bud32
VDDSLGPDTGPPTQAIPSQAIPSQAPPTQAMPSQPAPTGWVLAGRYRVLERIGSGGMAEVFRAVDELLNRQVAVKVFRAPVDEPGNATSIERREHELRALAQLSHPNLITLFDGSLAEGQPAFLVMELVVGPNLAQRLLDGPLPEPQVRDVGAQIADALAYVHARGMVHRDVKPANILLGVDHSSSDPNAVRARLSDFGIVRILDNARLTAIEFTLGTASYLAPEQARGSDVGPPADVYALGLVLIEALTGVRSFDGPQLEAVAARLVRSPDIPANLPEPWPSLLSTMTARDPASRPTAARVVTSLRSSIAPSPAAIAGAGTAGAGIAGAGIAGAGVTAAGIARAGSGAAFGPAGGVDSTQFLRPVPPGGPPIDGSLVDTPLMDNARRRRRYGVVIAALAIIAVIGAIAYVLLRSDSTTGPGTGVTTTPTPGQSHSVAPTTGAGGSHSAPATTSAPNSASASTEQHSSGPTSVSSSAVPSSSTVAPSSPSPPSSPPPSSSGPSQSLTTNTAPAVGATEPGPVTSPAAVSSATLAGSPPAAAAPTPSPTAAAAP